MDPGNWATDIAGGSAFGYTLLFVVLMSSICAMFLQSLSLKLGVVGERDLAQACRDAYPRYANLTLWILAEIAIAATDLAEVIGSATAMYLLFGLPLWIGILITGADCLLIVFLGARSARVLELLIFILCALIAACMTYELIAVRPDWVLVLKGFIPSGQIFTNPDVLYAAVGILGATVMPHNLYLHSSIIQTRNYSRTAEGKRMAVRYGTWDSCLSLFVAFFVNAAILILAAAAFYYNPSGQQTVADISDAYHLLAPAIGDTAARILFGVALLASGQNSTITGTLAGQIVMEGFVDVKLPPWLRRMVTRCIAIVPAVIVAAISGMEGAGKLLVLSQVILSLQLPFAIAPLVHFTSSPARMGKFVNGSPQGTIAAGGRRNPRRSASNEKYRERQTRKGKDSAAASVERGEGSVESGGGFAKPGVAKSGEGEERSADRSSHARRARGGRKGRAAAQARGSCGEEERAADGGGGVRGTGLARGARGGGETGRRGRAGKAKAEGRVGRSEERKGAAEGKGRAERRLLRGLRLEDFPPAEQGALVAERQAESETLEEEEGDGEEEVRGGEEEEEVVGLEGGSEEGGGEKVQEEIHGLLREAIAAEEAEARQVKARQVEAWQAGARQVQARQVQARQVEARSAPSVAAVAGTAATGEVTRRVKRGWLEGVTGRGREGRDREGRDREGRDREGRDREGSDREGSDREGRDREGSDREGSGGKGRSGELEVAGWRGIEGEEGGATAGEGGRAVSVVATRTHTETVPVSEEQQVVTVTETTVQLQVQQVGVERGKGAASAGEAEAEEEAFEAAAEGIQAAPAVPAAWRLDEQQRSDSRQVDKVLAVPEVGKQSAWDTGAVDAAAGPRGVKRPAAAMTQAGGEVAVAAGGGGGGGREGAGDGLSAQVPGVGRASLGGPSIGPGVGPGMGLGGMVTAMDERMMEVVVRHALQAREEAQRRKVQESARAVRDMRGKVERRRREARQMEEERDERLREMDDAVQELVRACRWYVYAAGTCMQVVCICRCNSGAGVV
ncbi:unnamed protein product [Closterium sp. Naga37s-1]|nr:unnamed protein product [Closterium sp. Naga37s-1]